MRRFDKPASPRIIRGNQATYAVILPPNNADELRANILQTNQTLEDSSYPTHEFKKFDYRSGCMIGSIALERTRYGDETVLSGEVVARDTAIQDPFPRVLTRTIVQPLWNDYATNNDVLALLDQVPLISPKALDSVNVNDDDLWCVFDTHNAPDYSSSVDYRYELSDIDSGVTSVITLNRLYERHRTYAQKLATRATILTYFDDEEQRLAAQQTFILNQLTGSVRANMTLAPSDLYNRYEPISADEMTERGLSGMTLLQAQYPREHGVLSGGRLDL